MIDSYTKKEGDAVYEGYMIDNCMGYVCICICVYLYMRIYMYVYVNM